MTETTLPALTGSPRQIAWAEKLRAGMLAAVDDFARDSWRLTDNRTNYVAQRLADGARPEAVRRHDAAYEIARAYFARVAADITEASWWIDQRDRTVQAVWNHRIRSSSQRQEVEPPHPQQLAAPGGGGPDHRRTRRWHRGRQR